MRSTRAQLPTRLRILEALRSRPQGTWTLDEMASAQGVERTVAFEHLELLVAANLATKRRMRGGRGRPANAYAYVGVRGVDAKPPQRTQLLSRLLAEAISGSPDGAVRAHQAGHRLGITLGSIDDLGGDYSITDDAVHAVSCMFESSCIAAREVVCGLHAGLIEGAMTSGGSPCTLTPLGPDGLGGCRFRVRSSRRDCVQLWRA